MILDECRDFIARYVHATDEQLDAMTLTAAATHAVRYGVTFPRTLFTSDEPDSGKTLAMTVTLALCANPVDVSGTSYAFQSALMEASNTPEQPTPTLYLDEVSDVFGQSGLSGSRHPVAEILRKGYKHGATRSASVNRVRTEYSIFTPFLMTGLRAAVPRDIRTRCVVFTMSAGVPQAYYDVREAEPYGDALQHALAASVRRNRDAVSTFRARGLHPKLVKRRLEIWEPLLATAYAVGGRPWLARALRAFAALALDESDSVPLTPVQTIAQDCAGVAEQSGADFIGGMALVDELRRIDRPLYAGRSDASLACLIRDALPCSSEQRRVDGQPLRGYPSHALTDAWSAVRPHDDSTPEPDAPAEHNPFEC